ncbi:MAG: MFS transporter [Nitrososphaeria archaeon]
MPQDIESFDTLQKRIILISTTMASFLVSYTISAINVALPTIGKEFNLSPIEIGWIQNTYLLASVVLLIPFGRLADIRGRKKVFLIGLALFTIFSFLTYFTPTKELFYILRFIQGTGASMIVSTSVAIITSVFSKNGLGKALGINTAVLYVGLSVGPYIGGFLTQNFGWKSIFISSVIVGASALSLTMSKIKVEWKEEYSSFDYIGTIFYVISLAAIVYGTTYVELASNVILNSYIILSIGILSLIIFILWQLKNPEPLIDIRIFRCNRPFTYSNLAALINYSATYMLSFLLSIYLQVVREFTPETAGLILISQPLVQSILSPVAGTLSDKIQPRIIASIGMGMNTIGIFLLTSLDNNTNLTFILADLIFMGAGFALFSSPNTNALMSAVSKENFGVANAVLSTMRQVGMIMSTIISTTTLTYFINGIELSNAPKHLIITGINYSFAISSVLCAIGVLFSIAGIKWKKGIHSNFINNSSVKRQFYML